MIEQPASIQIATAQDEDAVFDILVALHRESGFGWGFPYRPELIIETIQCGTRPDPATRSNPNNQRRGIIGLYRDDEGVVVGSIGVFLDPPLWFTDFVVPTELWLFVRPEARSRRHIERDLAKFARWFHQQVRPTPEQGYKVPFPLATGYIHCSHRPGRFWVMCRFWQRLFAGVRPVGCLFWLD